MTDLTPGQIWYSAEHKMGYQIFEIHDDYALLNYVDDQGNIYIHGVRTPLDGLAENLSVQSVLVRDAAHFRELVGVKA